MDKQTLDIVLNTFSTNTLMILIFHYIIFTFINIFLLFYNDKIKTSMLYIIMSISLTYISLNIFGNIEWEIASSFIGYILISILSPIHIYSFIDFKRKRFIFTLIYYISFIVQAVLTALNSERFLILVSLSFVYTLIFYPLTIIYFKVKKNKPRQK